ncbi:MAG: NUDIX domain-containing protein [Chloroflexi bacterium]|nr:NUDIX domain-containing protein [Chloroflexota bacterium]
MNPNWLTWSQKLQSLAQNGLAYTTNSFDIERYHAIREIASEIMAAYTGVAPEQIRDLFAAEIGHATPKVDVRGAVFQGDAILLVRERSDGRWTLPGGWADTNESPAESVVREIFEESGYRTQATRLLAAYDRSKHGHPPHAFTIYKLFFQCELVSGEAALSIETDGVDFFPEDRIPDLSLGRVTATQVARFFAMYRHPEWPADFD